MSDQTKTLNPNELWHATLGELQLQMTKATFDQWVRPTRVKSLQDGVLTVSVHSDYAVEWLTERLNATITRTVTGINGSHLEIKYVVNGNGKRLESDAPVKSEPPVPIGEHTLTVGGEYVEAINAVVKPDVVAVMTQYFRKKWVPLLGAPLAWIVLDLRQRAYWNRFSGERRDEFICTLDDIALTVGVTTDTVINALKKVCLQCANPHPISEHFILRRKPIYRDSAASGKRVCIGTAFRVRLDEPPTPEDARKHGIPDPKISDQNTTPEPKVSDDH